MSFSHFLKSSVAISVLTLLFGANAHAAANKKVVEVEGKTRRVTRVKEIIASKGLKGKGVNGEGIKVGIVELDLNPTAPGVKENLSATVERDFNTLIKDHKSYAKTELKKARNSDHGNHVSSLVTKVAPEVTLRPLHWGELSDNYIEVFENLLSKNNNIDIINISYNNPNTSYESTRFEERFKSALRKARDLKIGVVISAGNDSLDMSQNKYYNEMLEFAKNEMNGYLRFAVATKYREDNDKAEKRAIFSNYPSEKYSDLFLAAPGKGILSEGASGKVIMSGTSMSAPIVTGTAAKILGFLRMHSNQYATAKDAFDILAKKARKMDLNGTPIDPAELGEGIINVRAAVEYLEKSQLKEAKKQTKIIKNLLLGTQEEKDRAKKAAGKIKNWLPEAIGTHFNELQTYSQSDEEVAGYLEELKSSVFLKTSLHITVALRKTLEELESIFDKDEEKKKQINELVRGMKESEEKSLNGLSNARLESRLEYINEDLLKLFLSNKNVLDYVTQRYAFRDNHHMTALELIQATKDLKTKKNDGTETFTTKRYKFFSKEFINTLVIVADKKRQLQMKEHPLAHGNTSIPVLLPTSKINFDSDDSEGFEKEKEPYSTEKEN